MILPLTIIYLIMPKNFMKVKISDNNKSNLLFPRIDYKHKY